MSKPVSVLMSIYQPDIRFFHRQLESIAAQTYENMEVVIYNDDPDDKDRSDEIRTVLSRSSVAVRYYHGSKNLGYSAAFEKLVGLAHGTYIALCDQDDVWLPSRVERGVRELDAGYVLAVCDRAIIDGGDRVIEESHRHSHPHEPECNWNSGDSITPYAAFSCYAIGMATMLRCDIAKRLVPFPEGTAHDYWLTLGASQLGECAFIDEPLVQYRRHGHNVSALLAGVENKEDWYRSRVLPKYDLARYFCKLFPDSPYGEEIMAFAQARLNRDIWGLLRYRHLNPQTAYFEIVLRLLPDRIVRNIIKLIKKESL